MLPETVPALVGDGSSVLGVLDSHGHPVGGPAASALLPTGFFPLDEVLQGGLRPGNLVLLAGKPGQGKTILALQWARHLAAGGHDVVFACYEHDHLTLLTRLLLLELGEVTARVGCDDELRLETLRERLRWIETGQDGAAVCATDPLLMEAEERLRSYGSRLVLVNSLVARAGLTGLGDMLVRRDRPPAALFVDYLQKVPLRAGAEHDADRVTAVAEGLKELALRHGTAVVAITAAEQTGLASRRLHLHHSRGAGALAHESDVAVVLNDKLSIVSRVHLAYDTTRVYDFQDRVVFSVEKNRNGLADVHLEFRKDFANYRFHPQGTWVAERLWDEGSPEG